MPNIELESVTTGKNLLREDKVFMGLVLGRHPSPNPFI
jgi:hypothetical protein